MLKQQIVKFLTLIHMRQPVVNFINYIKFGHGSTEYIFTNIFNVNGWQGKESISGTGSDLDQTAIIAKELPKLLKELGITKMLDIPCGDFHWMKTVNLEQVDYIGADIVQQLINQNNETYKTDSIQFQHLNLLTDTLPEVDLILCRDCLVHLSFKDIFQSLNTIYNSKAKYLLTTHFPAKKSNYNIVTGDHRTLNFELEPFNFPKPIKTINEGCTEGNGNHADKSLALWEIAMLKNILND